MSELPAAVRPSSRAEPPSNGVRELMLGWCLWLLGSWAVTLLQASPLPGVRWMVFAAVLGLMLAWPAFRLSQAGRGGRQSTKRERVTESPGTPSLAHASCSDEMLPRSGPPPLGLIFLDWLCLMLVLQAVIWPLKLVGQWTYEQALWLDAAIAAWTLLTGALVAAGRQFDTGGARAVTMAMCVLVVGGEPAAMALFSDDGGWWMRLSPISVLWELTGRPYNVDWPTVRETVATAAAAAGLAWLGLAAVRLAWGIRRRG